MPMCDLQAQKDNATPSHNPEPYVQAEDFRSWVTKRCNFKSSALAIRFCLSQHQDFAIDPDMDAYTWPGSPNEDKFSPGPYSNSPPPDNSGYFDFSHSLDSEDSNNTSVLSLLQDLHLDNSRSLSPLSQFTLHPASARRFSDLDSSDSGSEHSFDLEDDLLYRSRSELFGEPV